MRLGQNQCDTLAIGTLTVANNKVVDEMFPAIIYFDRNKPSLCKESVCYVFEADATSIRMYYSGSVEFKGSGLIDKFSCSYDFVDYSLTKKGDLKMSYQFVTYGSDDPCEKIKYHTEELPKFERPQ